MRRQQAKICRKPILLTALFTLIAWLAPIAAPAEGELRALFIGNSLTFVNDLPGMLADLAKAGGQKPLFHAQETPGGCTLEKHWKDGKALNKIQSASWNYVILQEESHRPIENRSLMFDYARKFDAEVRKRGAKTMLYLTFARRDKPERQAGLTKTYRELANTLHAELVPVGLAWQKALSQEPNLVLHNADQLHPNLAGTYLTACVFYGVLYHQSPEGLPGKIAGLNDVQARRLQTVAWKVVQETAAASRKSPVHP